MNKKALVALGLIMGMSANSVLAEDNLPITDKFNNTMDRLAQAQRNANNATSGLNLAILNARNILEKSKGKRNPPTHSVENHSNKNRNEKGSNKLDPKPKATGRNPTIVEELNKNKKPGNRNPNDPTEGSKNSVRDSKVRKNPDLRISKQGSKLMNLIYNARDIDQLTIEQKTQLLKLHRKMLKTHTTQVLLKTITKGEGGGLLVIVGLGKGKSPKFIEYMKNLNTSTHPANQFPKDMRCFVHNKQLNRCSTAAGLFQITKTNFDYYQKHLGIKDFSVESQQIIALELIRTGKARFVRGNYKGRGYIEMIRGNLNNAIRYGTNDWASSPFSEWKGHKENYLGNAQTIAQNMNKGRTSQPTAQNRKPDGSKKLKDPKYYQNWLNEFETDRRA